VRVLKATKYFLVLVTLAAASVDAQAQSPRSPLSGIAHDVSTWFTGVTGTDDSRRREGSLTPLLIPLPRPRPTELTSIPVAPNAEPSKPAAAPVPANQEPAELTTSSAPNKEPSELTTPSVPPNEEPSETSPTTPNKEPSQLTTSPIALDKEWSEFTAAPVAPKKKAPAPVLIND